MSFASIAPPKTALGYHRILSPKAGVRVSPLCLGAMSIGEAWKEVMGSMDKDAAFKLMDSFYDSGGNFIDTSPNYQDQESERWIGEWMAKRGNRDEMVIATKFTTNYMQYKLKDTGRISANYGGNHNKSLHLAVRDSLKRLQTDYIDVLYVHWWDYTTSIEELMHSLDSLVKNRTVLYLGVSDTPAWIVSKANQYARDHGLAQFVIYQGLWSVMIRDFEREIIPMCVNEGLAIAPWGAIGGGKFKSQKEIKEREQKGDKLRNFGGGSELNETETKVSAALEKVADEHGGVSLTAVALAYCLERAPYVFPIVGGRKVEHLQENIKALEIKLSEKQIEYLESQVPYDSGFPHSLIGGDPKRKGETENFLVKNYLNMKWVKHAEAIKPQ